MEYLSARIPLLAADLLAHLRTKFGNLNTVSHDEIMLWLHEYASSIESKPVDLAFVRPDYESIKQQLQSRLIEKGSWKDLIQAGVGETLLEFIASIGAFSQLSIQRSLQESMLDTARLTSSVYTIARMLGVHINRKTPAKVEVTLTGDGTYMQIPRYSQFEIAGVPYFNRTAITLTDRTTEFTTTLYQGQVLIEQITSNGSAFQRYEIGESDFTVSDTDILVVNENFNEYTRVTNGLWHYEGQQYVFYENTTPTGNVELLFGNDLYGRVPIVGERLHVIHCLTLGEEAHTTRTNLKVSITELNDSVPERLRGPNAEAERSRIASRVQGFTVSQVSGGAREKGKEFYQALAPHIYSARDRAVTRADYYAMLMTYPGMVDVYVQGQQELGKGQQSYMNLIGITPLLEQGRAMTDAEFRDLTRFMQDKGIWQVQYMHIAPQPVPVTIHATVACKAGTDIPKVKIYLQYRFAEKFGIRRGSLGYSLYLNDIHSVLRAEHYALQVDYAELNQPMIDTIIGKTEFVQIGRLDLNITYSTREYNSYVPETFA